jgi:UPF0755 protein
MKRNVILVGLTFVLTIIVLALGLLFAPTTSFNEENATIYIHSNNSSKQPILDELINKKINTSTFLFEIVAGQFKYWEHIQPGKYTIPKGSSLFYIFKKLRFGRQNAVNLVVNKFRTKESFSKFISKNLEPDSMQVIDFLNNADSLKSFNVDTTNVFTMIIPDSYSCYWNLSVGSLMRKLYANHQQFWNSERILKAEKIGLSEKEVYILSSIIEEESNKNEDKPIIASVYLNRLRKNMRLAADPTIKFSLRNFGLKRIMEKHIKESESSPFNTYTHYGLPPGPICIPQVKTIDAVLDAANTDYLFFCAKPDFSGLHNFASNEKDHFNNAKIYRKFLDSLQIK